MTLLAQCRRIERHDGADKPTLARPMFIDARTAHHSDPGAMESMRRREGFTLIEVLAALAMSSVIRAATVTLIHLRETLIAARAA